MKHTDNYYSFPAIYRDMATESHQDKSACLNICSLCETGQEHKCELRNESICRYKPNDYLSHQDAEVLTKRIRWLANELRELKRNPAAKEIKSVQIKSINL